MATHAGRTGLLKKSKPLIGQLLEQLDVGGLSLMCEREYHFSPPYPTWRQFQTKGKQKRWRFELTSKVRQWRFDLALPDLKIAIEVQGGLFIQGAHSRGAGQTGDYLKYAYAQLAGWTILQIGAPMVRTGVAADLIRRAVDARTSNLNQEYNHGSRSE